MLEKTDQFKKEKTKFIENNFFSLNLSYFKEKYPSKFLVYSTWYKAWYLEGGLEYSNKNKALVMPIFCHRLNEFEHLLVGINFYQNYQIYPNQKKYSWPSFPYLDLARDFFLIAAKKYPFAYYYLVQLSIALGDIYKQKQFFQEALFFLESCKRLISPADFSASEIFDLKMAIREYKGQFEIQCLDDQIYWQEKISSLELLIEAKMRQGEASFAAIAPGSSGMENKNTLKMYREFNEILKNQNFLTNLHLLNDLKIISAHLNLEELSDLEKSVVNNFNHFYKKFSNYYSLETQEPKFSFFELLEQANNDSKNCDVIYFLLAHYSLQQYINFVGKPESTLARMEVLRFVALSRIHGGNYLKNSLEDTLLVDIESVFAELIIDQQKNIRQINSSGKSGANYIDLVTMATLKIYDIYAYLYTKYREFRDKNPKTIAISQDEKNKWARFDDFIDFLLKLSDSRREAPLRGTVLMEAKKKGKKNEKDAN